MHTVRNADMTHSEEISRETSRCVHCRRLIVWLTTCHDLRTFAFDPDPLPAKYDDGNGWAPGQFRVRSNQRMCFAPLPMHPPAKRRRIANVMRLHNCRQAA